MRRPNLPVTFGMERGDMQFVNNVFILHSVPNIRTIPSRSGSATTCGSGFKFR